MAAAGSKHQTNSREQEPVELCLGRLLGDGNCPGPHRRCRRAQTPGREETHLVKFFETVKREVNIEEK